MHIIVIIQKSICVWTHYYFKSLNLRFLQTLEYKFTVVTKKIKIEMSMKLQICWN